MTLIKICGVTLPGDAAALAGMGGVDFIGLNFWPKSKRYLPPDRAPEIADAARTPGGIDAPALVGVFVDAALEGIVAIARAVSLDVIQLHGDESPEFVAAVAAATGRPVWKAIPATTGARLDGWNAAMVLLDTPSAGRGGAGVTFDWSIARAARDAFPDLPLMLAGGLAPDNVAAAIAAVDPYAVDVASGVESAPGVKDFVRVTAFVAAVRGRR